MKIKETGSLSVEPKVRFKIGVTMSDLKPCPFCRGEAHHDSASCWNPEEEEWMPNFWHRVICKNCGTQTKAFYTEADAINAWNRRVVTDTNDGSKERTAKVYHKQAPDRLYYFYCGACGEMIDCSSYKDYKSIKSYCGYCGARLDWSE